jgi:ketosteroid isomerase-like protein
MVSSSATWRRLLAVAHAIGTRLARAIADQDEAALTECFAQDAELRALTPYGLREGAGAVEAASLISRWFGDSTELQLIDSRSEEVADRVHVSYRFEGVEEGEPYLVEQQLYCVVEDGRVTRADLLCSGFRPRISD